jgi:hypothetical protein
MKKQIKELILNPKNIIPAIRGNYKAWIGKQYAKQTKEKTKFDYIKSTATILSKCPNQCSYELRCCGCSIYAAVEENKQCKYKK